MEIGLALTFIGVVIAILTYLRTFSPPIEKSINNDVLILKTKFKLVQSIHLETQNLIRKYIHSTNAKHHEMINGITFGQFLEAMESEFENSNSDKVLEDVLKLELNKQLVEVFITEIDKQYDALNTIYQKMKILTS